MLQALLRGAGDAAPIGPADGVAVDGGLRYYVGEFWTAAQRQAHSLHEISYRACFKPQLPAYFIDRLTRPGETVFDPFSGRGTTALQAALTGRRPVASDINPLSAMLVAPRLNPPPLVAVAARLAKIFRDPTASPRLVNDPLDLGAFFHPATLRQINLLRSYLLARQDRLDPVDAWIRMVALNRLTGHSPGFFSVYTMPPNQAVSAVSQRRINLSRGQTPSPRDVAALILRKSRSLLADGPPPPHPRARLATAPADAPPLGPGEASLIVTSPPFLDVVDYSLDNWLRCWFAGIDPSTVQIDRHRDPAAWAAFVRRCLAGAATVLHPGGYLAFEVGEVRRGRVLLERYVAAALDGLPFTSLGVLVNRQRFTKTAMCWGVANNADGTNTNRIVLAIRQ